jgi:RNA polymerase sigma-70 factor (ECF subfamily)
VTEERELVAAALRGDPVAFAELVTRSRARVEAVVARMVNASEVEDVVQEALLHAYLGLSRLRDHDRFASWLCAIGVNLAKMRLRRQDRRIAVVEHPEHRPSADEDGGESLELVRRAVAVLPRRQREVVLMYYVDGLSCGEIAATVSVDSRTEALDARPSDALNLAVRTGAPIRAAAELLDAAATTEASLEELLARKTAAAAPELPDGDWASLSTELVRAQELPPRR